MHHLVISRLSKLRGGVLWFGAEPEPEDLAFFVTN
jgi:hypothetical protein